MYDTISFFSIYSVVIRFFYIIIVLYIGNTIIVIKLHAARTHCVLIYISRLLGIYYRYAMTGRTRPNFTFTRDIYVLRHRKTRIIGIPPIYRYSYTKISVRSVVGVYTKTVLNMKLCKLCTRKSFKNRMRTRTYNIYHTRTISSSYIL